MNTYCREMVVESRLYTLFEISTVYNFCKRVGEIVTKISERDARSNMVVIFF